MALEAQRESADVGLPMLGLGAIWVWVVNTTGWSLYPWKRMGPRTGLGGCGNSRLHRDLNPVASSYTHHTVPAKQVLWYYPETGRRRLLSNSFIFAGCDPLVNCPRTFLPFG